MGTYINGIAIKGENLFHIMKAEEIEESAKSISMEQNCPVLSACIYEDDYWGYTLYIDGEVHDTFTTSGDFHDGAADVQLLSQSFQVAKESIERYLHHWTDDELDELEEVAYEDDQYEYGDVWQLTDFLRALGFQYPQDILKEQIQMRLHAKYPSLREILDKNIPTNEDNETKEQYPLIEFLPSAFSADYIRKLLAEEAIREFQFEEKNPQEIIDAVMWYCASVQESRRNPVCQRLNILAGFCAYWLYKGDGWSYLDAATWEPVCLNYEKPTDIYLLRARAAITMFTKRFRAIRDLKRLIELDPENIELYQAEIRKWEERERTWRDTIMVERGREEN